MLKPCFCIAVYERISTANRFLAILYRILNKSFAFLWLFTAFVNPHSSSTILSENVLRPWVCIAVKWIMLFSPVLEQSLLILLFLLYLLAHLCSRSFPFMLMTGLSFAIHCRYMLGSSLNFRRHLTSLIWDLLLCILATTSLTTVPTVNYGFLRNPTVSTFFAHGTYQIAHRLPLRCLLNFTC